MEELEREYGISNAVKLASNENPLGPSPMAVAAMQQAMGKLHRYPDGSGYYLTRKLADKMKVAPENLVLGNGSDEVIGMLTRALLAPGDEVVMSRSSFSMYEILTRLANAKPVFVPLSAMAIDLDAILAAITPRTRLIFLTNPNNPTGMAFSAEQFDRFLKAVPPEVVVVLDEAYIEFARDEAVADSLDFLNDVRPLVGLRTFSKVYGLAGLRVGYGMMPPALAELLNRTRQPFNVNSLAQVAAMAAIDDTDFLQKTLQVVHDGLDFLYAGLDRLGIEYFPSQANFFLINVKRDAGEVFEAMLRQGVIIRSMISYGYPEFIRVTAGLPAENERFLKALGEVLS